MKNYYVRKKEWLNEPPLLSEAREEKLPAWPDSNNSNSRYQSENHGAQAYSTSALVHPYKESQAPSQGLLNLSENNAASSGDRYLQSTVINIC